MLLSLSTFQLTLNAHQFVIRSIGTEFYLFIHFQIKIVTWLWLNWISSTRFLTRTGKPIFSESFHLVKLLVINLFLYCSIFNIDIEMNWKLGYCVWPMIIIKQILSSEISEEHPVLI